MVSPRIYIYKITFEEVLYYYYGVHKEKRYNEYYMGTPVTHKWVWDFYIPKKQILEVFPYSNEGWEEAQEVEKRIIKEFYNQDKWCLNENVGGVFSLEVRRNNGKRNGKKYGKRNGKKAYEEGLGIHSLTPEQLSENAKKGGEITAEKCSKQFSLISPGGKIYVGKNIKKFCSKLKLDRRSIGKVLEGTYLQYKGWRKYIPDNITILDFL